MLKKSAGLCVDCQCPINISCEHHDEDRECRGKFMTSSPTRPSPTRSKSMLSMDQLFLHRLLRDQERQENKLREQKIAAAREVFLQDRASGSKSRRQSAPSLSPLRRPPSAGGYTPNRQGSIERQVRQWTSEFDELVPTPQQVQDLDGLGRTRDKINEAARIMKSTQLYDKDWRAMLASYRGVNFVLSVAALYSHSRSLLPQECYTALATLACLISLTDTAPAAAPLSPRSAGAATPRTSSASASTVCPALGRQEAFLLALSNNLSSVLEPTRRAVAVSLVPAWVSEHVSEAAGSAAVVNSFVSSLSASLIDSFSSPSDTANTSLGNPNHGNSEGILSTSCSAPSTPRPVSSSSSATAVSSPVIGGALGELSAVVSPIPSPQRGEGASTVSLSLLAFAILLKVINAQTPGKLVVAIARELVSRVLSGSLELAVDVAVLAVAIDHAAHGGLQGNPGSVLCESLESVGGSERIRRYIMKNIHEISQGMDVVREQAVLGFIERSYRNRYGDLFGLEDGRVLIDSLLSKLYNYPPRPRSGSPVNLNRSSHRATRANGHDAADDFLMALSAVLCSEQYVRTRYRLDEILTTLEHWAHTDGVESQLVRSLAISTLHSVTSLRSPRRLSRRVQPQTPSDHEGKEGKENRREGSRYGTPSRNNRSDYQFATPSRYSNLNGSMTPRFGQGPVTPRFGQAPTTPRFGQGPVTPTATPNKFGAATPSKYTSQNGTHNRQSSNQLETPSKRGNDTQPLNAFQTPSKRGTHSRHGSNGFETPMRPSTVLTPAFSMPKSAKRRQEEEEAAAAAAVKREAEERQGEEDEAEVDADLAWATPESSAVLEPVENLWSPDDVGQRKQGRVDGSQSRSPSRRSSSSRSPSRSGSRSVSRSASRSASRSGRSRSAASRSRSHSNQGSPASAGRRTKRVQLDLRTPPREEPDSSTRLDDTGNSEGVWGV